MLRPASFGLLPRQRVSGILGDLAPRRSTASRSRCRLPRCPACRCSPTSGAGPGAGCCRAAGFWAGHTRPRGPRTGRDSTWDPAGSDPAAGAGHSKTGRVVHRGGHDDDGEHQARSVSDQVTLASFDLLARVDALACLGHVRRGLHALGIHHGCRRFHGATVSAAGPIPQQVMEPRQASGARPARCPWGPEQRSRAICLADRIPRTAPLSLLRHHDSVWSSWRQNGSTSAVLRSTWGN